MEIVKTERSYVDNLRIVVQVRLNLPHVSLIVSCRVVSCRVVSCRVVSCRVVSCVVCVDYSCARSH
jgi:hypothetical protein